MYLLRYPEQEHKEEKVSELWLLEKLYVFLVVTCHLSCLSIWIIYILNKNLAMGMTGSHPCPSS